MGEAYGTVVAIILSAYLMFIAPLSNMMYQSERLEQIYLTNEITLFVEQIRNTGIMDEEMYLKLKGAVTSLNSIYTLEITHYRNVYNEDKSKILYFEEEDYLWSIEEQLQQEGEYIFDKNEYIKVTVKKGDAVTTCHGGSIKAAGKERKNENN